MQRASTAAATAATTTTTAATATTNATTDTTASAASSSTTPIAANDDKKGPVIINDRVYLPRVPSHADVIDLYKQAESLQKQMIKKKKKTVASKTESSAAVAAADPAEASMDKYRMALKKQMVAENLAFYSRAASGRVVNASSSSSKRRLKAMDADKSKRSKSSAAAVAAKEEDSNDDDDEDDKDDKSDDDKQAEEDSSDDDEDKETANEIDELDARHEEQERLSITRPISISEEMLTMRSGCTSNDLKKSSVRMMQMCFEDSEQLVFMDVEQLVVMATSTVVDRDCIQEYRADDPVPTSFKDRSYVLSASCDVIVVVHQFSLMTSVDVWRFIGDRFLHVCTGNVDEKLVFTSAAVLNADEEWLVLLTEGGELYVTELSDDEHEYKMLTPMDSVESEVYSTIHMYVRSMVPSDDASRAMLVVDSKSALSGSYPDKDCAILYEMRRAPNHQLSNRSYRARFHIFPKVMQIPGPFLNSSVYYDTATKLLSMAASDGLPFAIEVDSHFVPSGMHVGQNDGAPDANVGMQLSEFNDDSNCSFTACLRKVVTARVSASESSSSSSSSSSSQTMGLDDVRIVGFSDVGVFVGSENTFRQADLPDETGKPVKKLVRVGTTYHVHLRDRLFRAGTITNDGYVCAFYRVKSPTQVSSSVYLVSAKLGDELHNVKFHQLPGVSDVQYGAIWSVKTR
jgi:hypothetical protein